MLATFQAVLFSVLPIFLLIFAGYALRQFSLFDDAFWVGLNRLGFYLLYPVLLFVTIVRADFSGLSLGTVLLAVFAAWIALGSLTLALWPVLKRGGMSAPTFSSVFQSSIRWNGFIALAVAESLFALEGAAMVALLMATVVIPINFCAVAVLGWFTTAQPNLAAVAKKIALNPLIIGAGAAVILRALPFGLPVPIMDSLDLLARAALGMGLLAVGAGLIVSGMNLANPAIAAPVVLKLFVLPLFMITLAWMLGVEGQQLQYLALCASVPTAMNGYVLAREMGGDAPAYAATATLQTAIAFFSMPAILAFTAAISGG